VTQEYEVVCLSAVVEQVNDLTTAERRQVITQLRKLERAPQLGEALGSREYDLANCRRLVAGRLRVVFEVDEKQHQVTVLAVAAREGKRVYEVAEAELGRRRLRRIS
jgi:mRNA-degrading endonuclease RelE of RelBE toxin-antitoxin system